MGGVWPSLKVGVDMIFSQATWIQRGTENHPLPGRGYRRPCYTGSRWCVFSLDGLGQRNFFMLSLFYNNKPYKKAS